MTSHSPRLVLHIGPHKTATTYFQEIAYSVRDQMAAQGWLYPELGVPAGMGGQHEIAHHPAHFLTADCPRYGELAALRQEDGPQNIILSAEGMCHWPLNHFIHMANALNYEQVEIVYALRDPIELFMSHWSEEVKQGLTTGLTEHLATHYFNFGESRIFNALNNIGDLINQPRITLRILPFDMLRRDKVDFADHIFQSILGIATPPGAVVPARNESFSIELTEFLRLVNLLVSHELGQGVPVGAGPRQVVMRSGRAKELVGLMQDKAAHARRTAVFRHDDPVRERLEQEARIALDGLWSYDIGRKTLYRHRDRDFAYYSQPRLMMVPEIMEAAEDFTDEFMAKRQS